MSESRDKLVLFLDLGDVFTKVIAVRGGRQHGFRFPSVVARRLSSGEADPTNLLLDDRKPLLRPMDYDSRKHPRTRSYTGAYSFDGVVEVAPGERFAGVLAARFGADRQLLGNHPSADNIDALVRKAFLLSAAGCDTAELVFVVDIGAKADALLRHVEEGPREVHIEDFSLERHEPIQLSVRSHVVDAAACAAAALPPEVGLEQVRELLLIDIGYLRTKLTVISTEGCEHQEQLDGLGVSDCVRRILRDGQEQGLVEDEFAAIKALERSQTTTVVAGRHFEIGRVLQRAVRGLEEELARAAQRVVVDEYQRRAEMCRAVAIIGGGAAIVGKGLAARLEAADLGLGRTWVTADTSYLLVEGAQRIRSGT